MDVYSRLKDLGIVLEQPPSALGLYKPCVEYRYGSMLYTSGAGCRKDGKPLYTGKLGDEVSLEQGKQCARQCVLNLLSNIQKEMGDLNRIKRIVKVLGFVASADDFYEQPQVMNGASGLLAEIFGEAGVGARSAIGVNVLPGNIPVEAEMVVELFER